MTLARIFYFQRIITLKIIISHRSYERLTSTPVPKDAIHTLLSDLGIRPSDVFNQDICLLVEGSSDVIFFEHVIHNLYKKQLLF